MADEIDIHNRSNTTSTSYSELASRAESGDPKAAQAIFVKLTDAINSSNLHFEDKAVLATILAKSEGWTSPALNAPTPTSEEITSLLLDAHQEGYYEPLVRAAKNRQWWVYEDSRAWRLLVDLACKGAGMETSRNLVHKTNNKKKDYVIRQRVLPRVRQLITLGYAGFYKSIFDEKKESVARIISNENQDLKHSTATKIYSDEIASQKSLKEFIRALKESQKKNNLS